MFKANKSAYNHNVFTDRKEIIEIFENTYSEIERKKDSSSSVISIYGLSGTGKSFLRKELKRILETNYSNSIVISHDFRLKSEKVMVLETLKDRYCESAKYITKQKCTFPLYSYALRKLEAAGTYKRYKM